MKDFVFPFSTCEKIQHNHIIKQPYSAFVNALSVSIILLFLLNTKFGPTFVFYVSLFFFQFFHMFSHMFHLDGYIQTNVIHIISYFINFSLFYLLYSISKMFPSIYFIIMYTVFIAMDIYAFTYLTLLYFIPTQIMLLLSILFYYYQYLPALFKDNMLLFIFIILLISGIIYNEKVNGKEMLANYPDFPFHIFVEIPGLFIFTFLMYVFHSSSK